MNPYTSSGTQAHIHVHTDLTKLHLKLEYSFHAYNCDILPSSVKCFCFVFDKNDLHLRC